MSLKDYVGYFCGVYITVLGVQANKWDIWEKATKWMRFFFSPHENLICVCGPEILMLLNFANFYKKPPVKNNLEITIVIWQK